MISIYNGKSLVTGFAVIILSVGVNIASIELTYVKFYHIIRRKNFYKPKEV